MPPEDILRFYQSSGQLVTQVWARHVTDLDKELAHPVAIKTTAVIFIVKMQLRGEWCQRHTLAPP